MRTNYHIYTDVEIEWIKTHQDEMTRAKLTDAFNAHFGTSVPLHSIKDICVKRLGLKRSINEGCITKNDHRNKSYPIGTERCYNGYIWVKYNDLHFDGKQSRKDFERNWMQKQRYVYEKEHGAIPEGHSVIFLDNDKNNFAIENLYCIPRNVLAVMTSKGWFTSDPILTFTAIKWCELHYALKGVHQ